MPDITADDVSVVVGQTDIDFTEFGKLAIAAVTFGDGALTYPVLGVPLPEVPYFGFHQAIKNGLVLQPFFNGHFFQYDVAGHTLRIFNGTPKVHNFSMQNILGADADVADSMTVDQAAGPTNDDQIDTYAAVAAGAWAYSEDNEIDVPRNVALCLQNDSGGPINMEEAELSAVITGNFRGQAQTDTISETFTAGNKAIANGQFRWKYGLKPFEKVTSVVVTGLTANQNNLKIGIGLGRLLGVPVEPTNGVAADFIKVLKASANHAVTAYSHANKTLDLGAIADNDDFDIWMLTGGEMAGGVYAPPSTTVNLLLIGN